MFKISPDQISEKMTIYQNVIHNRTYARKHGKRLEIYPESVDRYVDYLKSKHNNTFLLEEIERSRELIKEQMVMPSMRLFFSAGPAVEAENAMAFNCKYQTIFSLKSLADLLYSLLCTCGVGISVERQYTQQIPPVPPKIIKSDESIIVEDCRYGWAEAFHQYLLGVFDKGISKKFDTHKVRDKGEPLITSGGFASGPEPLLELRNFIEEMLMASCGSNLRPVQLFDICCMIAMCAVQGGVRRAAIITLFDDDDDEMLYAKSKENLLKYPHRYNSNNTMMWGGCPERLDRAFEQTKINGEPGYLFKHNIIRKMTRLGRISSLGFGVNPCGEIILMPNQFCNLTEAVLRPFHTLHEDMIKVRYATILGLLQANLTDYNFISPEVKKNQDEDPIIGVSLTGFYDCPKYFTGEYKSRLKILKGVVDNTVEEMWKIVGLSCKPKAATCVKPSGTVSQLVNCASGIHPRYAKFYIRRVLIGQDSHLYKSLVKCGVPYLEFDSIDGRVFEFPMRSPEGSVTTSELDALQQMRYINTVNETWCDHNASCTIYVKSHEWEMVKTLLKTNHNFVSLSFLPAEITSDTSGFLYLPYEEITEEEYNNRKAKEHTIKWEDVMNDDVEESVNMNVEFACIGGVCAI